MSGSQHGHTKTCAGASSEVAKKQEKVETAPFSSNPGLGWLKPQKEVTTGSYGSTVAYIKCKLLQSHLFLTLMLLAELPLNEPVQRTKRKQQQQNCKRTKTVIIFQFL